MSKKYKKEKVVMIDLSDRKNIKIIQSEKTVISDHETEIFRQKLESRSEQAEEFCKYIIQKELESKRKISDDKFDCTMKELLKQHKILKSLIGNKDVAK